MLKGGAETEKEIPSRSKHAHSHKTIRAHWSACIAHHADTDATKNRKEELKQHYMKLPGTRHTAVSWGEGEQ